MTDTSARDVQTGQLDGAELPGEPRETREYVAPVGRIIGFVEEARDDREPGTVVRVLGVPYAQADRFRAPRDIESVPEPFLAFHRAPASPQRSSPVLDALLQGANDGVTYSEDCQALSITLPADMTPGERLPVMIWIHGGAYVTGAGDLDIYDPRSLVLEQRVIVVAVTFRLGILGFLGRGEPGDIDSVPANLGLLDLLSALRWINTNIESFGGASDQVTLFGQSAGGDAIAHLMISEGAAGLFQRAVVQSAPLGISRKRSRMAKAMGRVVGTPAPDVSIDDLLALQTTAELVAVPFGLRGGMPFGTQYGHAPLPAETDIDEAWSAAARRIDLLIGTTAEETALYLQAVPVVDKIARLPVIDRLLSGMLVRPTTQLTYTRDAHKFAARHRKAGGRAAVYEVTWKPDGAPVGAVHMIEIPLLLGSRRAWERTALVGSTDWDGMNRRGTRVREIWADFARTGRVPSDAAAGIGSTIRIERE